MDEGIHIASTFQLAGFSHVIGSLWPTNDCHSAKVSKDVYTAMLNANGEIDVAKAAEALHTAMRQLRDSKVEESRFQRKLGKDPLAWASYIYLEA